MKSQSNQSDSLAPIPPVALPAPVAHRTARFLGVAGTAIGPFGAQALLMTLGVDAVGGASGGNGGDTDDDEGNSDEEGARGENVGKRGGKRRSNSSSTKDNTRIANRNNSSSSSSSTRSSFGGVGVGGGGGGGGGRRAWRTIDMKDCCLARKAADDGSKDRASNASAFDPTAPNGDYT